MSFTPVNKFTVDRSKWGHGLNGQGMRLLKGNGCMCVLGFYGKACGLDDSQLLGQTTLGASVPWAQAPVFLLNDADRHGKKHGVKYKEARLISAFKRLGIKLSFKGKPKLKAE